MSKGSSPERPGSVRPDADEPALLDDAGGMGDGGFEPDPAQA